MRSSLVYAGRRLGVVLCIYRGGGVLMKLLKLLGSKICCEVRKTVLNGWEGYSLHLSKFPERVRTRLDEEERARIRHIEVRVLDVEELESKSMNHLYGLGAARESTTRGSTQGWYCRR
jgi:hypothetical protein